MPDEALISQIELLLDEIIRLGGQNEISSIVPNLVVQDADPAGLDGFILVSDGRDGDNITAKKVGSVIYSDNDSVNVMFLRGAEAIAFQQGSQSANSGIWEIVPSTSTDIFYDKGKVGIGTDEIPHEGVGWAKVAIDGADFDAAGPHMQFTTDADDYPVIQIFPWGHDENAINFDSYYDGAWRSSTTDQNFQILATGGRLRFRYDSGVAAGAVLTWNEGIALRDDGTVGLGTISPAAKLENVASSGAQLRLTHTVATKFADFTVDTNHDLLIKPSSTGQIKLQPTTDSTDFFQVLDADGGIPILNVDATNERVGIGTATPSKLAEILGNASSGIGILGVGKGTAGGFDATIAAGGLAGVSMQPTVDFSGNTAFYFGGYMFAGANVQAGVTLTTMAGMYVDVPTKSGTGTITTAYGLYVNVPTIGSTNVGAYIAGNLGVGTTLPSTRLDIDAGAMEFAEMTAPGGGAVNTARLYAVDNGAGKTQLAVVFNTGAAQILATQP